MKLDRNIAFNDNGVYRSIPRGTEIKIGVNISKEAYERLFGKPKRKGNTKKCTPMKQI